LVCVIFDGRHYAGGHVVEMMAMQRSLPELVASKAAATLPLVGIRTVSAWPPQSVRR